VSTLQQPPTQLSVPDPAGPPSPVYPAAVEIGYPGEMNRWLPLVKWLLAIPHLFALWFIGIGAFFVAVYAFFAVLFTGRWPRGAFDYLVGTFRWAYRVAVYLHLMTDAYPPFSMADDPDYPVRLHVEYPERIDNWRPLVQWLLAWPYLIVAGILYWLTGILTIVAFFTVLFTKQIPRGIFDLMVPGLRWNLRGNAYALFMNSRYPPFIWG
jgi:hypothetical protein